MEEDNMEQLIKFTETMNGKALYVKVSSIAMIRESTKNPSNTSNGNNYNGLGNVSVSSYTTYDEPGNTMIMLHGSSQFIFIQEHISEVIALMENRDPRPARILYGSKNS
jgi:hypothetical protein